jgi:hypothetical protein
VVQFIDGVTIDDVVAVSSVRQAEDGAGPV